MINNWIGQTDKGVTPDKILQDCFIHQRSSVLMHPQEDPSARNLSARSKMLGLVSGVFGRHGSLKGKFTKPPHVEIQIAKLRNEIVRQIFKFASGVNTSDWKGRVKSKSTHQPQKSGELISGKFCGIYRGPIWIILIIILITPFLLLLLSLQISKNTGRPCRGFGMVSPLNLTLGFRFRFAFVLIGLFLRSNT